MNSRIELQLKKMGYDVSSFAAYNRSTARVIESIPQNLVEWTLKFRILRGAPFSFAERPYLAKLYLDQSREINIVKPRQMEITEFGINWMLHKLLLNKYSVGLYMSDRFEHVKIFSNLRLRQWAIETSPRLKKLIGVERGNVTWLPFKNGSNLYMLSAWGDFEAARSIPADFAVIDEMQSLNVEALPVLKETMSKSKFKMMLKIGTGSDEGDGWWKEWNHGTPLEWKKVGVDHITGIEKFDWTSDPNSIKVDGINSYHFTQFMAPWITPVDIAYKQHSYSPRRFSNEVLGLWYRGTRKPLLEEDMRAIMDKNLDFVSAPDVDHTLGPVYIGIDWGGGVQAYTVAWVWQLTNKDLPRFRLLFVKKYDQPEDRSTETQADKAITLIDAYEADRIVIDAGGGPRQVEKLSNMYAERVYKVNYIPRPGRPFEPISGERRINVDRTWAIETIIDLIKRPETRDDFPHPIPKIILPGASHRLEAIEWVIDHFTCIEAETSDAGGRSRVIFTHPDDTNDDALHACVYAYLAWLLDNKTKWAWVRI